MTVAPMDNGAMASNPATQKPAIELNLLGPNWDERWDARLGSDFHTGFMQSSGWMNFKRREGYETERWGAFQGGVLVGGCTLLRYPCDQKGGIVYSPDGPWLPWEDEPLARMIFRALQEAAEAFGEKIGAVAWRIEPRIPRHGTRLLRNWRRAPGDVIPIETLELDLTESPEALQDGMHPKARYNLGLARRRGLTARTSSSIADLPEFYRLFQETALRRGFFAEPYEYFLNLAATLLVPTVGSPSGAQAELILVEREGVAVAALLLLHFGFRSTFFYGGSDPAANRDMPNHLLQWAAIEASRSRGAAVYDFFGCDPHGLSHHPYAGFSRFKRQWGGRPVETTGAHDRIFYGSLAERMVEAMVGSADLGSPTPT